jgi:diguanylate cyclase (GGDEF)-like protein
MPLLDLRTIVLLTGATGCLLSLVLFFLRRHYPPSIQGFQAWAAAPLVLFVSTLLFGLRDAMPPVMSSVVANVLVLIGNGLLLIGTRQFTGRPPRVRQLVVMLALVLPWLVWVRDDSAPRSAVMSASMGLVFAAHAGLIWRHAGRGFAARFTAVVLVLLTAVMAVRCVAALTGPPMTGLFEPTPLQTLYLTSYSFGLMMAMVGLILMASERLQAELQHLLTHDTLTGALTRRALYQAAQACLDRSGQDSSPLSLLVLDLDHFKTINDQHGHLTGDRVLVDFVQRLQRLLPPATPLGRVGGEEFVVVLPGTDTAAALQVAERILGGAGSHAAAEPGAVLPYFGVSLGLARFRRAPPESLEELIHRADAALYRAKRLGRGRVEVAPDAPASPAAG